LNACEVIDVYSNPDQLFPAMDEAKRVLKKYERDGLKHKKLTNKKEGNSHGNV